MDEECWRVVDDMVPMKMRKEGGGVSFNALVCQKDLCIVRSPVIYGVLIYGIHRIINQYRP